jgi:hypothetical protein
MVECTMSRLENPEYRCDVCMNVFKQWDLYIVNQFIRSCEEMSVEKHLCKTCLNKLVMSLELFNIIVIVTNSRHKGSKGRVYIKAHPYE